MEIRGGFKAWHGLISTIPVFHHYDGWSQVPCPLYPGPSPPSTLLKHLRGCLDLENPQKTVGVVSACCN